MLDHLGRELADAIGPEGQVDDRVGPAREVQCALGERFVHGHARSSEAGDAGPIAERVGDGATERQRHVLDGVVVVDLEVASGVDLDVDERVMRQRGQQVVVEAHAGGDGGRRPLPSRSTLTAILVSRVSRTRSARRFSLMLISHQARSR